MLANQQIIGESFHVSYKCTDRQSLGGLDVSHCHECYEILYISSGEGRYVLEGSCFDIKPGTLMVVKPYQYHCVSLDSTASYERYVINFMESALYPDVFQLLLEMLNEESFGKYYPAGSISNNVTFLLDRFESANSLPPNERILYLRMLLSELIVLLSASGGEYMHKETEELGARVIRYINENIERDVSLDRLARRFFVSKYYLCRAFKKHNGISIHGYINQKRVLRAKQLIEAGETASGAAYKVGFGDYSSFYRAYVKLIGKSPTAV